jgi:hypothetical protein
MEFLKLTWAITAGEKRIVDPRNHRGIGPIIFGVFVIMLLGCETVSELPAGNAGVVGSLTTGPLSVSVNSSGEIAFEVSPVMSIPTPIGTFAVGIYYDAVNGFGGNEYLLVIRANGKDCVYNLNGQDFDVEFDAGYYEAIDIRKRGTNTFIEIEGPGANLDCGASIVRTRQQQAAPSNFRCAGAYGPSLVVGMRFTVPYGDGPTGVYTRPNSVPQKGLVPEGQGGLVVGGPVCVEGREGNLISWQVQADNGLRGWVSEGYPHSNYRWVAPE